MKWKNGKIGIKKMAKTTCPNVNEFSSFEEVTRRGWVLLALPCLNVCVYIISKWGKLQNTFHFFINFIIISETLFWDKLGVHSLFPDCPFTFLFHRSLPYQCWNPHIIDDNLPPNFHTKFVPYRFFLPWSGNKTRTKHPWIIQPHSTSLLSLLKSI